MKDIWVDCQNNACQFYDWRIINSCTKYTGPRGVLLCEDFLECGDTFEPGSAKVFTKEELKHPLFDKALDSVKSEAGAKYDGGKPQLSQLFASFPDAILAVAELHVEGAERHGSMDNWRKVSDGYRRYTDALLRHTLQSLSGEAYDKDAPGYLHDISVLWNALTRLQLRLEGNKILHKVPVEEEVDKDATI